MRLMIVDDHAATREIIRKTAALPGFVFCECGSGDEALLAAREFKPDWVTMDVNMPGLDGFQATRSLRAEHPSARIVFVTAYNEPSFRRFLCSSGAVAIISKENMPALRVLLESGTAPMNPSANGTPEELPL